MIEVVDINTKDVATHIAGLLSKVAVPTVRNRNDLHHIQIDTVRIFEPTLNEEKDAIRFQFEMVNNLGAEIRVRLDQFAADPHGYTSSLLENLVDMQNAAIQRRVGQNIQVAGVRDMMGI